MNEWHCSECGCSLAEADARRSRLRMRSVSIRSATCTPECRERRRLRLVEAARSPATRARRQVLRRWRATIARKASGPDGEIYRFALSLRALRTTAGLTVRELAARAGIAYGYVPMMEAAKLRALPSDGVLRRLARALGTSVGELRGAGERVFGQSDARSRMLAGGVAFAGEARDARQVPLRERTQDSR